MSKMTWMMLPAMAAMMAAVSCAQKKEAPKVLVIYYSQNGGTKAVAEEIANALGADMEAIEAVVPYDGNFQETIERSGAEREQGILPDIQPLQADLAAYDLIFLGYPVWFGTYAPPIAKLLENPGFSGKKIVPFCTFGSGGLLSSAKDLAEKLPDAEILPGYGVRAARMAAMPAEVDQFLKANGYVEGDFVKAEPFPESHPASEEEAAIFDAAVAGYPMINAKATDVAARAIPGGTEYLFTAEQLPREGMPPMGNAQMQVYVTALEGAAPEFTQVVR